MLEELLLPTAVFAVMFVLFFRRPLGAVHAYLALAPYIGGNAIFGLLLPYAPGKPLGFLIILFAILRRKRYPLNNSITILLCVTVLYMTIRTIVGYELLSSQDMSMWLQSPLERGIKSLLGDCMFVLLPAAIVSLTPSAVEARRLLRTMLISGYIYISLGIMQLCISIATHNDIFPMTRQDVLTGVYYRQSFATTGIASRITSICGEPRYFAAHASIWLIFALWFAGKARLHTLFTITLAAMSVLAIMFSGSRTGTFTVPLALAAAFASAWYLKRRIWRQWMPIGIVIILAGIIIALGYNSLTLFGRLQFRSSQVAGAFNQGFVIGPVILPAEPAEIEAVGTLDAHKWGAIFGYGSGMWQYYSDVMSNRFMRNMSLINAGATMGSVRPNSCSFTLLLNYGVIGLVLFGALLRALMCHPIWRDGTAQMKEIRFAILASFVVMEFGREAQIYAAVCMCIVIMCFTTRNRKRVRVHRIASAISMVGC